MSDSHHVCPPAPTRYGEDAKLPLSYACAFLDARRRKIAQLSFVTYISQRRLYSPSSSNVLPRAEIVAARNTYELAPLGSRRVLTLSRFDRYWPLIDNLWSRNGEINLMGRDKIPYDSIRFTCRSVRKFEVDNTRQVNPARKRRNRDGGTCSCRVKAKKIHGGDGLPDHYRFEHSSPKESDWVHSHSIDELDSNKINTFLKTAAAVEAAKGSMPEEVYKTLRSVKILDGNGLPIGDALDAAGGKFMIRMLTNNAKQAALSAEKSLKIQHASNAGNPLKRSLSDYNDRGSQTADLIAVDPRTIWPSNLGRTSVDHEEHANHIRADIRLLVESIAIGLCTHVPREVLLPMLNSIAEYMDDQNADVEGKPLLEMILRVQENASLTKGAPILESSFKVNYSNGNGSI